MKQEAYFKTVKKYIEKLNYRIAFEDDKERVFIVDSKDGIIRNLVIGCSTPLLLMEQYLFDLTDNSSPEVLKKLLQKNRDIVYGAFALDESGTKVIFRDTLQIENLDLNELEGSLESLKLLLKEFKEDLSFSPN